MKLADSFQHPHIWNSLQPNIRAKATFSLSCLPPGNEQGKGTQEPSIPAVSMAPLMTNPCSGPPQTFCLQSRLRLFPANPPPSLLSFHLRLLSLLLPLILHTLSPSNFLHFFFILASSSGKTKADTVSIIILSISQWMKGGSKPGSRMHKCCSFRRLCLLLA